MKILVISPDLNYPPIYGGRIRRFNIIKQLSKYNEITLLSFFDSLQETALTGKKEEHNVIKENCLSGIKPYCKDIYIVDKSRIKRDGYLFRTLISKKKRRLLLELYYTWLFTQKIKSLQKIKTFDLAWIEYWYLGKYKKYLRYIPVILDEVDVEFVRWRQLYNIEKNSSNNRKLFKLWKETEKKELEVVNCFDFITNVTGLDKEELYKHFPDKDYYVLPTGVDCDYFKPENGMPREGCRKSRVKLVFTGSMLACFNQDSVLYFYNEIWPILKKKYPNIHLTIVGLSPPSEIRSLEGEDVSITGSVPDIRRFVYDSDIYIAPLTYGSGIKGKVLEAMAMGIPVVTTSVGVQGLEVEKNMDILVSDSPEGFAEKIINLVEDEMLYKKLSINSIKIVKEKYDWNVLGEKLNEKINKIVKKFERNRVT